MRPTTDWSRPVPVKAARGAGLRARGWRQEGLLRMLENVLEVGERPSDLIVYAALAQAARDWPAYHRLVAVLKDLRENETLVVQSGKPIGVFASPENAPLVVTASTNMVGRWQTPERFYELRSRGLTMWGGLTAAAWQYIGYQGVLQGTYELLAAIAREHFGGDLRGRLVLTAGLGGMGSAQPIAINMCGAVGIIVEVDPDKVQRRSEEGYVQVATAQLDEALRLAHEALRLRRSLTIALVGNAADVLPEIVGRGVVPDVVSDQTAAHDALLGYVPRGLGLDEWRELAVTEPQEVIRRAKESMAVHVRAMLDLKQRGAVVVENGNNLRVQAYEAGLKDAFEIDQFSARYLRPLFSAGIGPFRWVALSGEAEDIYLLDKMARDLFSPSRPEVGVWLDLAREHVRFQGLPARSCWLGHAERGAMGVAANQAVRDGRLSGPVLFTRDHFDAAGMTHPRIATEAMADGSDGISDWPLLDALLLASVGADLVAVHAGGGGYSGFMQSAGVSIVADGSEGAEYRLRKTLDADTGLGVLRYADAGYETARAAAKRHGLGFSDQD
jgi:urocanate hydratase